jgi:hypothetical protein
MMKSIRSLVIAGCALCAAPALSADVTALYRTSPPSVQERAAEDQRLSTPAVHVEARSVPQTNSATAAAPRIFLSASAPKNQRDTLLTPAITSPADLYSDCMPGVFKKVR